MEKKQVSTKPTGACERIYKAVAENCPLRTIHRLSMSPMSENAIVTPNHLGGRTTDSPSRTRLFLRKLVSPVKTHPRQVNIPIHPGPSILTNEKEKMTTPSVSQQNGSRVIVISAPKTQSGDHSTTKGNKTGPPAQSQPTKPATERLNITVASGNAPRPKVSSEKEAKTLGVPVQEKPLQKTGKKNPPNIIVIQSPGLQPKPKNQPAAHKEDRKPTNNAQGKEDTKPVDDGAHDHNHKYTAYIERVKNQLSTKSNIGEETTTTRPPMRTATRRDSFNDKVSNFITRAKKNIKTTHLGD